jgi:hypothetical protein
MAKVSVLHPPKSPEVQRAAPAFTPAWASDILSTGILNLRGIAAMLRRLEDAAIVRGRTQMHQVKMYVEPVERAKKKGGA